MLTSKCKSIGCTALIPRNCDFCADCENDCQTDSDTTIQLTGQQLPLDGEIVPGRKDDSGKLDITLLFDDMPHALEAVTEVLQWAITKKEPVPYVRGSWQGVQPFQPRYRAAQLRHMLNAAKHTLVSGEVSYLARDQETNLLELAHIATDAMFQLEMACRELEGIAG